MVGSCQNLTRDEKTEGTNFYFDIRNFAMNKHDRFATARDRWPIQVQSK